MTVRELIETLEELEEAYGEDCEVRLMEQPAYPMEYEIDRVKLTEDEEEERVIYLLEGTQLGYGTDLWSDR